MRKVIFLLVLLFILISSSCGKNTDVIKDLNENSNLDFNFAEDENNLKNVNEFENVGGFGGYGLASKDSLTKYFISGYPDCLDKFKVTGFETKNPKYSIYGIRIGLNAADAIELLESKSFSKDVENSTESGLWYKNGKVIIRIYIEDSKVEWLSVRLEVTNKKNVQF